MITYLLLAALFAIFGLSCIRIVLLDLLSLADLPEEKVDNLGKIWTREGLIFMSIFCFSFSPVLMSIGMFANLLIEAYHSKETLWLDTVTIESGWEMFLVFHLWRFSVHYGRTINATAEAKLKKKRT